MHAEEFIPAQDGGHCAAQGKPSERLLRKIAQAMPTMQHYAHCLWMPERASVAYPIYLRTMHMVVRSAVPLMTAAEAQARLRASDPLCERLAGYYASHALEEKGHDEWLREDLAATGDPDQDVIHAIPSPVIASMVGAQYYWLHHYHPVSLLGHIAALECNHPPIGFANHLTAVTGFAPSAFRAIARHEVLDQHHRREFIALIDNLPLTPTHERMIGLSALHTLQMGIDVLRQIAERCKPVHRSAGHTVAVEEQAVSKP